MVSSSRIMLAVDEGFAGRLRAAWGDAADDWLRRLPDVVEACAVRWGLREVGAPFPGASYNVVMPAVTAGGAAVVLKLGLDARDRAAEAAALEAFAGRGTVRLLAADPDAGALLLERAAPGTSLWTNGDDIAAVTVAGEVMRRLHVPAAGVDSFPAVADWGRGFARHRAAHGGGAGPIPARLFGAAEETFSALERSAAPAVLLQGDLHHGNIVDGGERGWLAIDPKGVLGEPAYEPGAFIRNPTPDVAGWPDLPAVLSRRAAPFGEDLNVDGERVAGWAFAQAVLSAVWSIEDGEDPAAALTVAEALGQVLGR